MGKLKFPVFNLDLPKVSCEYKSKQKSDEEIMKRVYLKRAYLKRSGKREEVRCQRQSQNKSQSQSQSQSQNRGRERESDEEKIKDKDDKSDPMVKYGKW